MSHFAELAVSEGRRWAPDRKIRAVYRATGKHSKHPCVAFFVQRSSPFVIPAWIHAGSLRWVEMQAAEREGKSLWPLMVSGKLSRHGFKVTPADVRALAVRLDQWLEMREAA